MTLHGWRQLVEWSIEHACLTPDQQRLGYSIFKRDWEEFCVWINEEYGAYADGLDETR